MTRTVPLLLALHLALGLTACRNGSTAMQIPRTPLATPAAAPILLAPTQADTPRARPLAAALDAELAKAYPKPARTDGAARLAAVVAFPDAERPTAIVTVTLTSADGLPTHRQAFTLRDAGDPSRQARALVGRLDHRVPAETEPLIAPRPRPGHLEDVAARRALSQALELLDAGLTAEAADRLADLATRHPEPMVAYALALAADAAGRHAEAREAYRRAAGGLPETRWARFAARRADELAE